MKALPHRLPTSVLPLRYHVDLSADPDQPTFEGTVTMTLDVVEPTGTIEMHARELDLEDAVVRAEGSEGPATIALDPTRQVVRFTPRAPLAKGPATLTVRFRGPLAPSMHGIYLATDGSSRCVCTQCQATDARAIFPCFDEPEFKAELAWTLRVRDGLVALANGPLVEEHLEGQVRRFTFASTPRISSYLAALCIGDLEPSETRLSNGTPLRVWGTRGKKAQTRFGLEYTEKLFPYYEDYFGVPYPFAKYDQVGVPGFDAGAMENVGLVLFRQNYLLIDPATASWRQEKIVAKVIAHELAHMWFGNLVTLAWWDDLWLNEAFAEWFAHKAVDATSPDYRVWEDFQDDMNRALVDDALPTTHSIYTPVETPDQAIELFDVITYQKGCAVMRMLERFLGEHAFRAGLRTYMQAFAYKNAAGPDLWAHLERASGQPVGALMRSWISVAGFPVIDVRRTGEAAFALTQRRFYSSPARAAEPSSELWSVPMTVRYADDDGIKTHRHIFSSREQTITLPARGAVRWMFANADEIGFYRVRYDDAALGALLGEGLATLNNVERMGLLEDQWSMVRNGSGALTSFLELLEAYTRPIQTPAGRRPAPTDDHNVLRAVADRLGALEGLLEESGDERALAAYRRWVVTRLSDALAALGLTPRVGESQNDVQRRALLIAVLGRIGRDPAVLDAARYAAEDERRDPKQLDPNLAGPFLSLTAMTGDAALYQVWVDTYRARRDAGLPPQVNLRYLHTLAEFRPAALVARTLAHLDDGLIPQEAVGPVLGQLLSLRHAREAAWHAMKASWPTLRGRVGDMGVSRVVEATASLPPSLRGDVVAFFEANPPVGAERALSRALERMDERRELVDRLVPPLRAALAARSA
jgi:puromycin-sensitive aminopeptidase